MDIDERLTAEETISILSRFRALVYRSLSGIFSVEPDRPMLEGISYLVGILDQAPDLSQFFRNEHFLEGQRTIKGYFAQTGGDEFEPMINELAKAYAFLFLGVGEQTIGLCESVYRTDLGLLFQASHFEVQEFYERIGTAKNDSFCEPADHIAVELSYMAELCRLIEESMGNGAGKTDDYLKTQKVFCERHMLPWVPALTRKIIEGTDRFPFYRAAAYLLDGFIKDDFHIIALLLKEARDNGITT